MTVKELFKYNKEIKVQGGCLHQTSDYLVFNSYVDGMLTGIPLDDVKEVRLVFKGNAIAVKTNSDYMYTWFLQGAKSTDVHKH